MKYFVVLALAVPFTIASGDYINYNAEPGMMMPLYDPLPLSDEQFGVPMANVDGQRYRFNQRSTIKPEPVARHFKFAQQKRSQPLPRDAVMVKSKERYEIIPVGKSLYRQSKSSSSSSSPSNPSAKFLGGMMMDPLMMMSGMYGLGLPFMNPLMLGMMSGLGGLGLMGGLGGLGMMGLREDAKQGATRTEVTPKLDFGEADEAKHRDNNKVKGKMLGAMLPMMMGGMMPPLGLGMGLGMGMGMPMIPPMMMPSMMAPMLAPMMMGAGAGAVSPMAAQSTYSSTYRNHYPTSSNYVAAGYSPSYRSTPQAPVPGASAAGQTSSTQKH